MSELGESTELANELAMDSMKRDEAEWTPNKWHTWVAMSTLLMALLAAVGALLAGITAHEALLYRTEEVIAISIVEGSQVCVEVLKAKHEILISLGEMPDEAEIAQIQAYDTKVAEFAKEAAREEASAQKAIHPHLIFAIAVTLLAVGTSLGGMAIILDQKLLWYTGMVFGVVGTIGVSAGVVMLFQR